MNVKRHARQRGVTARSRRQRLPAGGSRSLSIARPTVCPKIATARSTSPGRLSIHKLASMSGTTSAINERERVGLGQPPKEQPPRKLSGTRTARLINTLESGAVAPADGVSRDRLMRER